MMVADYLGDESSYLDNDKGGGEIWVIEAALGDGDVGTILLSAPQ